MHYMSDDKKSLELFANIEKLKNTKSVTFISGSGIGKAEVFATISHDADEIVIHHGDVRVKIDSHDKEVLGTRDNEKYLDDETIYNVVDMCVHGTPDYKAELQ